MASDLLVKTLDYIIIERFEGDVTWVLAAAGAIAALAVVAAITYVTVAVYRNRRRKS